MLAALLIILSFNHQFVKSFLALAFSQDSNSNNNHNKFQTIIYYNIFSDLSRNFTGTVGKFKHNDNNNDNNNPSQDSDNTRHK
ncbi:MAG TPA: hypothetical protein VH500_07120 [Nitrososphaeraceae archaeon]